MQLRSLLDLAERCPNDFKQLGYVEAEEIGGKKLESFFGLFQMDRHSAINLLPQLVIRSCQLNQTLNEESCVLGTPLPDGLPSFVSLPEFAGIKEGNSAAQVLLFCRAESEFGDSRQIDF